MRFAQLLLCILLALTPLSAYASSNPSTGFIPSTLWFSRSEFYAGESVRVYTVLFNGREEELRGTLIFTDNDEPIETTSFSVAPLHTKEVSALWKPKAGKHMISAHIEKANLLETNGSATSLELDARNTPSIEKIVEISPETYTNPLGPFASSTVLETIKDTILKAAGSAPSEVKKVATEAQSLGQALFEQAEKVRGEVKGAFIKRTEETEAALEKTKGDKQQASALSTVQLGIERAVLFLISNGLLLYSLMVIFLIWSMRFAYKRMTARPFDQY